MTPAEARKMDSLDASESRNYVHLTSVAENMDVGCYHIGHY
jgi:hypothetical protein